MQIQETFAGEAARSVQAASSPRPTALPRTVAGCFSIAAFAVALLAGLFIDNPAPVILQRAIIMMAACYPAGWMVGVVMERVIRAHLVAHASANPAPALPSGMAGAPGAATSNPDDVIVV